MEYAIIRFFRSDPYWRFLVEDIYRQITDMHSPFWQNVHYFHAVFRKIWWNLTLAPLLGNSRFIFLRHLNA